MTNTAAMKNAIARSGLKKAFIASKIGVCYQTLSSKINNRTQFKSSEIETICELLGISDLEEKNNIFFAQYVGSKPTERN